jgi:uncharacterized membrane protein YdbT with pleckstrin-like domain
MAGAVQHEATARGARLQAACPRGLQLYGAKTKFAANGCDVNSLSEPGTKSRLGHLTWPLLVGAIAGGLAFLFLTSAYLARKGSSYAGMVIVGTLVGVVATVVIGRGLIRLMATEVAVSNRRVLIKTGLFSRKSIEVLLPKVKSIGVDESLFGRMLGYGSVIVRGTGGTFETFDKIAHPNELRRQVQEQIGARESH